MRIKILVAAVMSILMFGSCSTSKRVEGPREVSYEVARNYFVRDDVAGGSFAGRIDTQKHVDQCRGAYVGNLLGTGNIDWNQIDVDADGYINCKNKGTERIYEDKYNLFPIPSGQSSLNPEIGQNPGWN